MCQVKFCKCCGCLCCSNCWIQQSTGFSKQGDDDSNKGVPSFHYYCLLTLLKRGRKESNPCKKTAEIAKAYGNGIKSANIFTKWSNGKGGGVKGVLKNVKKTARFVEWSIPYVDNYGNNGVNDGTVLVMFFYHGVDEDGDDDG